MIGVNRSVDSPLYWPIAKLQSAYRTGELSPVEVLEEALARTNKFDGEVHAYLSRLDDLAREQALAAELAWRRGEAAPLSGVPLSVKDTFDVAGYVSTYGSRIYQSNRVSEDCGVVKRLRMAGAVLTGKTNTSEFTQSATGENKFFDDSHNPWDISRTTGGSSAGAAASVAAGFATAAIGTDGGGSIRIPASFTGLVGVKPTYGLCHDERGFDAMSDFSSPGPIAWCVADARSLLSVLADKHYRRKKIDPALHIAWCPRPGELPCNASVLSVVETAVLKLADLGHQVTECSLDFNGWQDAFSSLVLHNEHRRRDHLLDSASERLMGYERRTLEVARTLSQAALEQGRKSHAAYRHRIKRLFAKFDILVMPTTAVTAFPIKQRPTVIEGQTVDWLWGAFPNTAPFNVAGTPAVTLPCGFANALPVGMQLVGPAFSDELLLNIAEDIEEALAVDRRKVVNKWI